MYADNRKRFLDVLRANGACAVIPGGTPPTRNADSEYRFRPSSDFFYLTGFREPDAVLVLAPQREDEQTILFLREKDPEQETWTGRRLGLDAAPEVLGVDLALPIEALWDDLPGLLIGSRKLVYRAGEDAERDRSMIETISELRRRVRGGVISPVEWIDPLVWLHEQRLRKTEAELKDIRKACAITAEAHIAAMRAAHAGVNEAELDAELVGTFRRHGSTGPSYTNIVAGGANACILHYIENDQAIPDGDLVLIDAGAEWNFYASDVTRTFPVNGTFSPEQRALYELVLRSQKAAIAISRPGITFEAVHDCATRELCAGLIELGLLKGSVDEALESGSYKRFYMHRTGHWLGLDVHDCGLYHTDGTSRPLEAGMLMTIEPGLYVDPDDDTVEARWRGIGIRIEDDVLLTKDGCEILTKAIPKEIEEVEAACRGAELSTAHA